LQFQNCRFRVELFNNELKSNSWAVLGFIGVSLLELDEKVWTVELTKDWKKDGVAHDAI